MKNDFLSDFINFSSFTGYEGDGKTCQEKRSPCDDRPCAAGTKN